MPIYNKISYCAVVNSVAGIPASLSLKAMYLIDRNSAAHFRAAVAIEGK